MDLSHLHFIAVDRTQHNRWINNAASCLEGDFVAALRAPLKSGYPSGYIDLAAQAYNAFQTSIQQGRLQTSSDTEQARADFIVQLNNADMSVEFVDTLCSQMADEIRIVFPNMTQRENEKLDSCLGGFRSVRDTLRSVVDFGLQQLRSSAVKPRLHTWIDQFVAQKHELNEEELAAYEAGETFVQSLIVQVHRIQVDHIPGSYERTQFRCIGGYIGGGRDGKIGIVGEKMFVQSIGRSGAGPGDPGAGLVFDQCHIVVGSR